MTKEEMKRLKYVENQRDSLKKTLAVFAGEHREARNELEKLRVENAALVNEVTRFARESAEWEVRAKSNLDLAEKNADLLQLLCDERDASQAKLTALQNDNEGTARLKKRLAAQAEELRLVRNELGALKAARVVPKSLDAMVADCITQHGADAVIGHIMSNKVRP